MFDAQGIYSPPDAPARHVLVVTKAHIGFLGQARFAWPIPAGAVIEVAMLGHTNVPRHDRQYLHPEAGAAWIEHATANVGDVIPEAELTLAVALAAQRMEAVKAFWAKVKAERPENL